MLTIEKHQVVYDPEDGREPKIWDRASFPFADNISTILMASIEHDRGLYHIVYKNKPFDVIDVQTTADNADLDWLDTNIPSIEQEAYPPETLDEAKARRVEELTGDFTASFINGFLCSNGITMDAGKERIMQLDAGYRLVQQGGGTTLKVRDFNNTNHDLPIADVNQMITELGQNWQTQLYRLWTAKDAVAAATTIAQVDAVQF